MNILIIGQGIAGSCLAWELKRRGSEFTVADRPVAETASRWRPDCKPPDGPRLPPRMEAGRMPSGGRGLFTRKRNGN